MGGYQTFSAGIGSGNTCYYCATDGVNWEIGTGTVGAGTLTRDTIHSSSNTGGAVNWGVGAKDIFVTLPAKVCAGMIGALFT